MSILFRSLVVFITSLLADVAWARYTLAVSAMRDWGAALWGVSIILIGVVTIDAYIHSRWYVVPSALGAAIGTYATVRHAKETS